MFFLQNPKTFRNVTDCFQILVALPRSACLWIDAITGVRRLSLKEAATSCLALHTNPSQPVNPVYPEARVIFFLLDASREALPVDRRCYAVSEDAFVRRRGPSPETAYPPTALIHRPHQRAPNSNPGVTRGVDFTPRVTQPAAHWTVTAET